MWLSTVKYFSPSFSYMWWFPSLRDGDGPAAGLARGPGVQGVQPRFGRVLPGVQRDLPGLRQDHELGEVVVRPDDVPDDVLLAGHEVERGGLELAAVPEDELVAGRPGHLPGLELDALLGDEVEDHGGAA